MSGLILCDRRSDVPYRITEAEINVYSLEEIAYFLYNNAYFVDDSFFKSDLVDYVEKHLKLSRVAQKLRYAMANRAGFYELVMIIMSSTSYYNDREIKGFEKELKAIGSKSMLEKMKARGDMLYDNKRFLSARKTYYNILKNKGREKQDNKFYSDVHTGLGKVYMKMFYFEKAVEEFKKAYDLSPLESTLTNLINAKLVMEYATDEMADLKEENTVFPALVLRCEEEFKDMMERIALGKEYERNTNIFTYDGKRNVDDFYGKADAEVESWKNEYRRSMI